jgi:hypothetical protein
VVVPPTGGSIASGVRSARAALRADRASARGEGQTVMSSKPRGKGPNTSKKSAEPTTPPVKVGAQRSHKQHVLNNASARAKSAPKTSGGLRRWILRRLVEIEESKVVSTIRPYWDALTEVYGALHAMASPDAPIPPYKPMTEIEARDSLRWHANLLRVREAEAKESIDDEGFAVYRAAARWAQKKNDDELERERAERARKHDAELVALARHLISSPAAYDAGQAHTNPTSGAGPSQVPDNRMEHEPPTQRTLADGRPELAILRESEAWPVQIWTPNGMQEVRLTSERFTLLKILDAAYRDNGKKLSLDELRGKSDLNAPQKLINQMRKHVCLRHIINPSKGRRRGEGYWLMPVDNP